MSQSFLLTLKQARPILACFLMLVFLAVYRQRKPRLPPAVFKEP
jgi:hypothetical protein